MFVANQPPHKILIVRLSAIGDVLMASPLARALRDAYPAAHIAWMVEPLAAPFVRANPYVDEVILLDTPTAIRLWRGKRYRELLRTVRHFVHDLRRRRFDVVIDTQGLLKSGLAAWLSGAPRRIGKMTSREGNARLMTETVTLPWPTSFLAEEDLAQLAPLGIARTPASPILEIAEEDHAVARAFLYARGITFQRYVACCISSSRPQKNWPWSRWEELADHLLEQYDLRTVFIGGPECKQEGQRLADSARSQPVSTAGMLSLLQSSALVQDAEGVIGVDTGLTYVGASNDVPTVILFGSTLLQNLSQETCIAVCHHPMPCMPCGRHPTCADYPCMSAITVEEVAQALQQLIKGKQVTA